MSLFNYEDSEAIGGVFSVDTGSVLVRVEDVEQLRKLQVNHLVALRSSRTGQHLIGIIHKIMRKALMKPLDEETDEATPEDGTFEENIIRVTLIGTLKDKAGEKPNVFQRTLESVPEIDARCFILSGERLTKFMQAISIGAGTKPNALSLGKYTIDEDANAWLDGNRFFQRHAVLVGATGSGKSCATAHILEQVEPLQNSNAILFDIHGEYKTIEGDNIQHFHVAGPSDLDQGTGLADNVIFLPYWLLTYEEMIAFLLDRSDLNAPNQAMLFARSVTKAKKDYLEKEDKNEILKNFTIDSPVPYSLDSVIGSLKILNEEKVPGATGKPIKGDFHGKLSRFLQRLEAKIGDRRLGFMFGGGKDVMDYDWMLTLCTKLIGGSGQQPYGGVKIIDFSEVPSDVLPLMTGMVARLVFSIQQWTEKEELHPIAIFCDEAHLYIPEHLAANAVNEAGFRSFERIAKEGRKYGVGLVVISQRPSEVNRTILSQCNNFIAMRLTNAEDQSVIRRLLPDSLGGFSELLPILDTGEAIVVGDASLLPSRIRIDLPKKKPTSATIDFWDEWSKKSTSTGIANAVESLRLQAKIKKNLPVR